MTLSAEDAMRIRENLRVQAAERSIDAIIQQVEEGISEFTAAACAISAADLEAVPEGESWTPLACITHATGSNIQHAQQILYVALSGELPAPSAADLPPGREALLARHREAIDSLYAHVRDAPPDAFLDVRWNHQFFGDLNWREWLLFLRLHARDHARQLTAMRGG